jgi:hypothetical protein
VVVRARNLDNRQISGWTARLQDAWEDKSGVGWSQKDGSLKKASFPPTYRLSLNREDGHNSTCRVILPIFSQYKRRQMSMEQRLSLWVTEDRGIIIIIIIPLQPASYAVPPRLSHRPYLSLSIRRPSINVLSIYLNPIDARGF